MRPKVLATAVLIAACSSSLFAQLPPLVQEAFRSLDTDRSEWAYTMTSVDDDGQKVQTFDPSRPQGQRWRLVTKNGKAPTAAEVAEYQKDRQKREAREEANRKQRGGKNRAGADLVEMIRPGSLKLVRESPSQASYEFRLADSDGDEDARELIDAMKGRMTIAKDGPWLQTFEFENEKPLKPVAGVRIDRMYTRISYRAPAAGVPPLLGEMRVTLRGRAFLVKKLDADNVATYSDYRRVAGPK